MVEAEKTFHVRIQAKHAEALQALPIAQLDTACMGGIQRQDDGSLVFEALVRESVLKTIKNRRNTKVDVLADRTEEGKKRQKEVGRGNRFTGENWIPRGLGKKMPDEVQR